jgi:hypothetical protein
VAASLAGLLQKFSGRRVVLLRLFANTTSARRSVSIDALAAEPGDRLRARAKVCAAGFHHLDVTLVMETSESGFTAALDQIASKLQEEFPTVVFDLGSNCGDNGSAAGSRTSLWKCRMPRPDEEAGSRTRSPLPGREPLPTRWQSINLRAVRNSPDVRLVDSMSSTSSAHRRLRASRLASCGDWRESSDQLGSRSVGVRRLALRTLVSSRFSRRTASSRSISRDQHGSIVALGYAAGSPRRDVRDRMRIGTADAVGLDYAHGRAPGRKRI